jgi:hypothetical protein
MTEKEFRKALPIKVYCKSSEISVKVQKKLFELGYKWLSGFNSYVSAYPAWIFLHTNNFLSYSDDESLTYSPYCDYKEVNYKEILSINKKISNHERYEQLKKCLRNIELDT